MSGEEQFGHLLVERSGGIGGFLLVWDLNIDQSAQPAKLGERVADLPWPHRDEDESAASRSAGSEVPAGGEAPAGTPSPSPQPPAEPPSPPAPQSAAGGGADRYVYLIESRFGYARFGEKELTGEWKDLVDHVREVAEPERRPPGGR